MRTSNFRVHLTASGHWSDNPSGNVFGDGVLGEDGVEGDEITASVRRNTRRCWDMC